jgi:hypothetical protein
MRKFRIIVKKYEDMTASGAYIDSQDLKDIISNDDEFVSCILLNIESIMEYSKHKNVDHIETMITVLAHEFIHALEDFYGLRHDEDRTLRLEELAVMCAAINNYTRKDIYRDKKHEQDSLKEYKKAILKDSKKTYK